MVDVLSHLMAAAQLPVGAYIIWRCIATLRRVHDHKVRSTIYYVLAVAAALVALRLAEYSTPLEGAERTAAWSTMISMVMLVFLPIINTLARSDSHKEQ